MDLQKIQAYMQQEGIGAWLVYDFRGVNPVLWQLLGQRRHTTRRVFLIVPAAGAPRLLGSAVEPEALAGLGVEIAHYASWEQLHALLRDAVDGLPQVAMEYWPGGTLPMVSWVDGGTLDLVRSLGPEVVSSADLCQVALATWSADALASHRDACRQVAEVKDAAFEYIRRRLHTGFRLSSSRSLTEFAVQSFIVAELEQRGLDSGHPPIVAVNGNSGNPHYEPHADTAAPIEPGAWILIDLWARHPGEQHVFGDMTWVAFAGPRVPAAHAEVFAAVREARDQVLAQLDTAWRTDEVLQGWQLDQVARQVLTQHGLGEQFVHRTGHSLGPGPSIHALGVNLDDLETHDARSILPGTGFSVEPGAYLPEFGVRLEVNVYVDPETGPEVTTPIQNEVILLL
ncbi:MAG: aminopeptidase P family protein [Gemmatimonadetes bacterium]|nr:aminopeptidase P family protein [Gemmatimonadota bacterium]